MCNPTNCISCDKPILCGCPQDFPEANWHEALGGVLTGGYGSTVVDGMMVEVFICDPCIKIKLPTLRKFEMGSIQGSHGWGNLEKNSAVE